MSDIVKKAKARDVTEVAIPCISSVFTSRDHEYEANGAEDGDHEGPGSPCPDGPGTRSEGGALEHNEASSSNDLASTISNKLEAPIRHPVVPVARSGIHNSVAVDPSVAEAQDRLNALLDNIDSKRKREEPSSAMAATVESPFDWVRYKDPQTTMDYYYNIRTGVTQWERPAAFTEASVASTAGSVSTGGYLYGVGGDQYVAQASFNKKAGSFGAAGATTYWEQVVLHTYAFVYIYITIYAPIYMHMIASYACTHVFMWVLA
jgi:hypothetical protein